MTIKHSFISLTNQLQSIAFSYSSSYIGIQSLTYNHYHPIIQTFPKEKHNYGNQAFTPPIFLLTHSSLTIHLSPPSIENDRNNQAITPPIIPAAQTLLSDRSRAPSIRNKKNTHPMTPGIFICRTITIKHPFTSFHDKTQSNKSSNESRHNHSQRSIHTSPPDNLRGAAQVRQAGRRRGKATLNLHKRLRRPYVPGASSRLPANRLTASFSRRLHFTAGKWRRCIIQRTQKLPH